MAIQQARFLKHFLPIVLYGSLASIIQAITYIILTSIGLAAYTYCVYDYVGTNEIDLFSIHFKLLYFSETDRCNIDFDLYPEDRIMSAYAVKIWSAVYLAMSVVWLISAVIAVYNIGRWENIERTYRFALPWIVITSLICLMDLIMGVLFGVDLNFYNKITIADSPDPLRNGLLGSISTGILMTVAFRGYVIWILNTWFVVHVAYGVYLIQQAIFREKRGANLHNTISRGPISAYDNSIEARSTRWLSNDSQNLGRPHLQPTKVPSMYGYSESNQGVTNQGYVQEPINYNHRLAPAHHTMPNRKPWERDVPATPKPDYSPQPIRQMRSALKSVPPSSSNNYMR